MEDLEKIKFVTANYYELQGLRWVIWGVVCLFVALEEGGVIGRRVLMWGVLPVGILLFAGVSAHYMRRYGAVIGGKPERATPWWTLLAVPVLIAGYLADKWLDTRPFVMPMVFALWFIVTFWMVGRKYRRYYMWIAIAMVVLNLVIGVMQWPERSLMLDRGFVTWMLVGWAMIVGGSFDHRLVARTLNRREEKSVGAI